MAFAKPMVGRVFGKLTVVRRVGSDHNAATYECHCACGNTKVIDGRRLRRGLVSCGCYRGESHRTHGGSSTPEFAVWLTMKARCSNENQECFSRYGGRGIKVCERWMAFENFLADMGRRPSDRYSIERINNEGDYEPSNCRWATIHEQTRNRRNNINLTHGGETMCLKDWAAKIGIEYGTLWSRFKKGWTTEQILTTPVTDTRFGVLPTTALSDPFEDG